MQDPTKTARQKAKTLLLVMSITTTLGGWGIISVIQSPALPAAQAQSFSAGSGRSLFSIAQPSRPIPVAITRSSN